VWSLTGPSFAGALADPIEAWLRCGPAAARDTVVHGTGSDRPRRTRLVADTRLDEMVGGPDRPMVGDSITASPSPPRSAWNASARSLPPPSTLRSRRPSAEGRQDDQRLWPKR
jgi:hypothetical protein